MSNPFLPATAVDKVADVNALLREALAISQELTQLIDQASTEAASVPSKTL